jgi:hypothetical protein
MADPTGASAATPPASTGATPASSTPLALPEGWTTTVADRIVSTVDTVRSKTTTPIEKASRAVIWGLLIATAGLAALVVLVVGVFRLLYEAVGRIPGLDGRPGRSVWVVDVVLGLLLLLVGLSFVRRGRTPRDDA